MSIFARFSPEGAKGLILEIASTEADEFNSLLKELINDPNADVERRGYNKRFLDAFRAADLFLDANDAINHDDALQYDAESNTLLAAGLAITEGRRVPLAEIDPKLERIAEHVYMNYHEARATAVKNTKYHEGRGSGKGKDIDHVHLALTNGLMLFVFLRYCMCVIQLLIRRHLNVMVPVKIGRDADGTVYAVADGDLLDPVAYQRHVENLLHVLLDHLVVKD